MKYDYFLNLAKQEGLDEAELLVSNSSSTEIELFRGQIEQYEISSSTSVGGRGIYNNKLGTASANSYSKEIAKKLVEDIKENAKTIEQTDPIFIYGGSEKYHKTNVYNKELNNIPLSNKINKLYEIENKLKEMDKRIVETDVAYSETSFSNSIINTKGLNLTQKGNYFLIYCSVVVKENEQTKSGGEYFISNDFNKIDVDNLVKEAVKDATSKLGGVTALSKTYKAVLSNSVVSSFMNAYISNASSEDVQKHSSLFINKLGEKIASSKVTIEDRPLSKTIFAKYFDDEGVATSNRAIIKNGVLQTYLYNLTTAAKDGVNSTGNGFKMGGKMGVAPTFITLKIGKKSLEELFKEMRDGVYITEVQGLHAGLNPQSGDFSLQSSGFLIEDGKISHPLDMITISGNLMDIFKDVVTVGSDARLFASSSMCPSVLIKKIKVAGQ